MELYTLILTFSYMYLCYSPIKSWKKNRQELCIAKGRGDRLTKQQRAILFLPSKPQGTTCESWLKMRIQHCLQDEKQLSYFGRESHRNIFLLCRYLISNIFPWEVWGCVCVPIYVPIFKMLSAIAYFRKTIYAPSCCRYVFTPLC